MHNTKIIIHTLQLPVRFINREFINITCIIPLKIGENYGTHIEDSLIDKYILNRSGHHLDRAIAVLMDEEGFMEKDQYVEYQNIHKVGILWYDPNESQGYSLNIDGTIIHHEFRTDYYLAIGRAMEDLFLKVFDDVLSIEALQSILLASRLFKSRAVSETSAMVEQEYDMKSFLNYLLNGQTVSNTLPEIFRKFGIKSSAIKRRHHDRFQQVYRCRHCGFAECESVFAWGRFSDSKTFSLPFILHHAGMQTGYFSNRIYRKRSWLPFL